jgi:hypothetical protein
MKHKIMFQRYPGQIVLEIYRGLLINRTMKDMRKVYSDIFSPNYDLPENRKR